MHVDTQISRGLERIMARNAGQYLEGMYGLSGMGACDTFGELEEVSQEAGVPNARAAGRKLRAAHRCACQRMKAALPVAVAVQAALEEASGPGAAPLSEHAATLAGIGELLGATSAAKIAAKAQKAAAKAQKKIAKIEAKEAKQEAKVAAKVAKLVAAGKQAKADKVIAKDAKQDAKIAAKITKQQGIIAAAQQAVQAVQAPVTTPGATTPTATVAPSTPVTPTEAAAAVLTNQAQLPATAAVSQLAQEVVANTVAPGSAVPTASLAPSYGGGAPLFDPAAPAATEVSDTGGIFANVSPLVLAGGAGLILFLVMGRKGRR